MSSTTLSDSTRQVKLLFAGDIMGHTPQIKAAEVIKNKSYNYRACFQYILPIIRTADIAIGNLEVTLPGEPPYTGYPIFRSPDDLAKDLKWAGFDLLTTANNHSNDAKGKGVIHTIETLKNVGFYQTGTFKNKKERALFYPLIINKNGIKLAFLNYTYGTNGIATTPPTIVNKISLNRMQTDILKAKKRQADFIIVLMHWGDEYELIENQRQRQLANWLAEQGVDLVVGAHPHVVQPIETKITKNKKGSTHQTVIAYSLGNFVSNQDKQNTDGGILLEVNLSKDLKQQKTTIQDTHFIPIWRHIATTNKRPIYQVLPIAAFEGGQRLAKKIPKKEKAAMQNFARITRTRLRNNGAKERKITATAILQTKKIAQK